MKRLKFFVISLLACLTLFMPVTGCSCSNPAEEAADTIEGMASQEDKAQDAVDAFKTDANEKDAEYQEILDIDE